jgi:DnaJ-class molecular chaperone
MAKDYYDILGVKKNADEKQIKSAYRKLARKLHPDVNPGDKAAEERFKQVNTAFEVLSDPEKRKKYDRYGDNWEQAEAFEKARAQAGTRGGGGQTYHFDIGDMFGRGAGQGAPGGFEDIFGNIFGGRGRRGPMRGQNVEYEAAVSLEEAYAGTVRTLQMQGEEACPTCGGAGQLAGAVCHVCQGSGAVIGSRRLEVKIPAGAKDGTRVRIAGEGEPGVGGGPRGDLYVVVRVAPHGRFERKGDDLWTDIRVPVEDAVLGGEAEVQTIAGKRIAVRIPPLTQNGKSIKLGGLGMPVLDGKKPKGSGDMYVRVKVTIPEKLTDRQRSLFEQLRAERERAAEKVTA